MKALIAKTAMILIFSYSSPALFAQDGPPPPPDSGHGATANQPPEGGNAPLGSGLTMFLVLGLAYGLTKAYGILENKMEEEPHS